MPLEEIKKKFTREIEVFKEQRNLFAQAVVGEIAY